MWLPISEPIEKGRWLVAVYNDGSGAVIFMATDNGYWEADGNEFERLGGFERYAYLPEDFRAWAEDNNCDD